MDRAARYMDGLTVHHYTLPLDSWTVKGSATVFDTSMYYRTIRKTLRMEELLTKHAHIMDGYDPEKRVALIVDEWGSWYDVEPGTNPGFLYQQNTMRDAIIAGVNLNIFNKFSDRVRMANIAQTVNVLQAVILTEGSKMVLTPTYHVFDLYKVHQDATLLESYITTDIIGTDEDKLIDLNESASIDSEGRVHITVCNIDAVQNKTVEGKLLGYVGTKVSGQIVSGEVNAHNTFDRPEQIDVKPFTDIVLEGDSFTMTLPPCSVVRLSFE